MHNRNSCITRKVITERFLQSYVINRDQIVVRVTSARNVIVNIFGDVTQNGSYTISAMNTAFNAIVAAGGPTHLGGIRAIQLIRDGVVKELDVYDFLLDPSVAFDYQLAQNDIIFVHRAVGCFTVSLSYL